MSYETTFDPADETATFAVLRALAAVKGVEPIDIQPPLFESLDPSALDGIIVNGDADTTQIIFVHAGYRVSVESNGRIIIQELTEADS